MWLHKLIRKWVEIRLASFKKHECRKAGHHLRRILVSKEGRWETETEPIDWNNYHCDHCSLDFFQYVNCFGEPVSWEINH
jgi:hypothetical protein